METREEKIKNIKALIPMIVNKAYDIEREANIYESYTNNARNNQILDRKCYELRDLVNELVFKCVG